MATSGALKQDHFLARVLLSSALFSDLDCCDFEAAFNAVSSWQNLVLTDDQPRIVVRLDGDVCSQVNYCFSVCIAKWEILETLPFSPGLGIFMISILPMFVHKPGLLIFNPTVCHLCRCGCREMGVVPAAVIANPGL